MRVRALKFMHDLIVVLESNGHSLKLENKPCHIERHGQLIAFNLRQKFYRVRKKENYCFSYNIFVKSRASTTSKSNTTHYNLNTHVFFFVLLEFVDAIALKKQLKAGRS